MAGIQVGETMMCLSFPSWVSTVMEGLHLPFKVQEKVTLIEIVLSPYPMPGKMPGTLWASSDFILHEKIGFFVCLFVFHKKGEETKVNRHFFPCVTTGFEFLKIT